MQRGAEVKFIWQCEFPVEFPWPVELTDPLLFGDLSSSLLCGSLADVASINLRTVSTCEQLLSTPSKASPAKVRDPGRHFPFSASCCLKPCQRIEAAGWQKMEQKKPALPR